MTCPQIRLQLKLFNFPRLMNCTVCNGSTDLTRNRQLIMDLLIPDELGLMLLHQPLGDTFQCLRIAGMNNIGVWQQNR